MIYDQDDINNLALVTWKESRGEGADGMRAVMHVIVNRVAAPGFPKTIHDVIFQKYAFSSMTVPTDKEFTLQPKSPDSQYDYCVCAAPAVLSGSDPDITKGAVYYSNEDEITSGWYRRVIIDSGRFPITVKIGKQTFRA